MKKDIKKLAKKLRKLNLKWTRVDQNEFKIVFMNCNISVDKFSNGCIRMIICTEDHSQLPRT